MTDWNRFFSGDQLRNAIQALFNPGDATATNTYLGSGSDNLPRWNTLPTATQAATATDVSGNPGFAKAWFFSSTASATGLILGNNISGISRTSVGNYTVNFTAGPTSTNYAWVFSCQQDVGTLLLWIGQNATGPNGQLATSFDFICVNSGGAAADPNFMSGAFYW